MLDCVRLEKGHKPIEMAQPSSRRMPRNGSLLLRIPVTNAVGTFPFLGVLGWTDKLINPCTQAAVTMQS
jgi:hypothetical protein